MTKEELEAARLEQEKLDREKAENEGKDKSDNKDKDEKPSNENKPSDTEAKLIKEVMKLKAAAREAEKRAGDLEDRYKDIDLEALLEAAKKAEEVEKAELERKGDYERLTAKMKESHLKEIENLKETNKALKKAADEAAESNKNTAKVNAFSNSRYIIDNLALTPNKTKALYGDYFEYEDGDIVGYDKPKGSSNRTKIVDGSGDALSFDEAMKVIIESDPDKDTLIKTNLNPGSGSEGNRGTKAPKPATKQLSSLDKIMQGMLDSNLL